MQLTRLNGHHSYTLLRSWTLEDFYAQAPHVVSNRFRFRLYAAKGHACIKCGLEGTHIILWFYSKKGCHPQYHYDLVAKVGPNSWHMITMDHHLPHCFGGRKTIDNINPMCYSCNSSKANKLPEDIMAHLIDFMICPSAFHTRNGPFLVVRDNTQYHGKKRWLDNT